MHKENIRQFINQLSEDNDIDILILTNQSYDNSIVGYTEDFRLIYDYNLMIEELAVQFAEDDGVSPTDDEWADYLSEAQEWIDYNTIRALPYMGERAPIIMYPMEERMFD